MADYRKSLVPGVVRTVDNVFITADPTNVDWQEYLAYEAAGGALDPCDQILPQELMAQFTPADMVKIRAAINADTSGQMDLLWSSMVAQKDPMVVTNARFLQGWSALIQVLGTDRMNAIAAALNVTVTV